MRQEFLEQLIDFAPLMNQLSLTENAISIWDETGTLQYFYKSGQFPLNLAVGYTAPETDPIYTVLRTGKVMKNTIPPEVFGIAIEGNIVPLRDEGSIVGCIICAMSIAEKTLIEEKTNALRENLVNSMDNIVGIQKTTQKSADYFREIEEVTSVLQDNIKNLMQTVQSIKNNSKSTKILALNASIEAARAKEAGLGFNIVAKEMSHLSELSANSVAEIEQLLSAMTTSMSSVSSKVNELTVLTEKDSLLMNNMLETLNKSL